MSTLGIDERPASMDRVVIFAFAEPDVLPETWHPSLAALARACRAVFDAFRREEHACKGGDGDPALASRLYADWLALEELTDQHARKLGVR